MSSNDIRDAYYNILFFHDEIKYYRRIKNIDSNTKNNRLKKSFRIEITDLVVKHAFLRSGADIDAHRLAPQKAFQHQVKVIEN